MAYFRGDIRKCQYEIEWTDEQGEKQRSFIAVRGPVETKINFIQKHGISIDSPNYSLSLLLPQNEETLSYFKRYTKFYLQGQEICWRVEALDWLSTPGILEVHAMEYYANEYTIKSRPALNTTLYEVELVRELPVGVTAFKHPALEVEEEIEE